MNCSLICRIVVAQVVIASYNFEFFAFNDPKEQKSSPQNFDNFYLKFP